MSPSAQKGKGAAAAFAVALVFALGTPAAKLFHQTGETVAAPTSPADIDGYYALIQLS